jgi:hypothetical protein
MSEACRFFLFACLYGFGACLSYDLLRLFRRMIPHSLLFIHGEDLLFFALCAAAFLYGVWSQAQGQLRGYYFLGIGLSGLVYVWGIHPLLGKPVRFFRRISGRIRKDCKSYGKSFGKCEKKH